MRNWRDWSITVLLFEDQRILDNIWAYENHFYRCWLLLLLFLLLFFELSNIEMKAEKERKKVKWNRWEAINEHIWEAVQQMAQAKQPKKNKTTH